LRPADQLFLFPGLDPFKTIIKDIDYVDVSDLVDPKPSHAKLNNYSLVPKGKFILFKEGFVNPYRPELGKTHPFIKNKETGKILAMNMSKCYLRSCINVVVNGKIIIVDIKYHRVNAIGFVENDNPKKKFLVDHKNSDRVDNRASNLRWVDNSLNNKGVSRSRDMCWEEKLVKKGKI
jgi:hypothetical protein|tara:strand:+ start:1573 stop:2103 length:531 start_codon:yes stop_codon:yes gene_type:complete